MRTGSAITRIVHDDLCIACGACVEACPEAIVPSYSEQRGAYEVRVESTSECVDCDAVCERVCPSIEVDFSALLAERAVETGNRIGPVRSIWTGYSPEHRLNGITSSGGVIRALIEDKLSAGGQVICLAKLDDGYGPALLEDFEALKSVPGSIYHSTSFIGAIGLLRDVRSPCTLISTPCQLEGIVLYARECEPEILDKIGLSVGIICGWMYSDHANQLFASYKGIKEPLIDVSYRGGDKVGKLRIRTRASEYEFDRRTFTDRREQLDYISSYSSVLNRQRCRLCEDHINVLADIAVGDAWLERKSDEKLSILVVRSARGEAVIDRLSMAGQLRLEAASVEDIIESQSENLVFGTTARKLNSYLSNSIEVRPKFTFGEAEASPTLGAGERLAFWLEQLLRRTVRARWYGPYRLLYRVYERRAEVVSALAMPLRARRALARRVLGRRAEARS